MISKEDAYNLLEESNNDLVNLICTMSNYIDDIEEKLSKAQNYIKDLEEQLKAKEDNGWMRK